MSSAVIGEVLFYPCPCLNAAHILCYVVGLLYQRKDDAVLSILRSWRKQGQSQSVERNGNGTLGLVLDDGNHLHGSLHCGLRFNREKTFQFVRSQVLTMLVWYMEAFFPRKALNRIIRNQTVTHCLVENSLYRFLKQHEGISRQSAAICLYLPVVAVTPHIVEQAANQIPVHIFQQDIRPLCPLQVGGYPFADNTFVCNHLLAVAAVYRTSDIVVTLSKPSLRLGSFVILRLFLLLKGRRIQDALRTYLLRFAVGFPVKLLRMRSIVGD